MRAYLCYSGGKGVSPKLPGVDVRDKVGGGAPVEVLEELGGSGPAELGLSWGELFSPWRSGGE